MADTIPISQLPQLNSTQVSASGMLPITNATDNDTYKILIGDLDKYVKTSPNSGQFFIGTSAAATFATSSATSLTALTASYASGSGVTALTASYALSSSTCTTSISAAYASVANTVLNFSVTIVPTSSMTYYLAYNPASPNNGTASYSVSSSNSLTASYASGSGVTALTASYSYTASFSNSSSIAQNSNYSVSSSHSNVSDTASYAQAANTLVGGIHGIPNFLSSPIALYSGVPSASGWTKITCSNYVPSNASALMVQALGTNYNCNVGDYVYFSTDGATTQSVFSWFGNSQNSVANETIWSLRPFATSASVATFWLQNPTQLTNINVSLMGYIS